MEFFFTPRYIALFNKLYLCIGQNGCINISTHSLFATISSLTIMPRPYVIVVDITFVSIVLRMLMFGTSTPFRISRHTIVLKYYSMLSHKCTRANSLIDGVGNQDIFSFQVRHISWLNNYWRRFHKDTLQHGFDER